MSKIGILESVIADQRAESTALLSSPNLVERDIPLIRIRAALKQPNAVVITGVRRSGKSILALRAGSTQLCGYINFDDERLLDFAANDLHLIERAFFAVLGREPDLLIFDEIQNIKGWELFVNRLRRTKRLIITGSNAHLLSSELATRLTGRYLPFTIFPFSFLEFIRLKGVPISLADVWTTQDISRLRLMFKEYLQLGGFPETHSIGHLYPGQVYSDIITKDIIVRKRIRRHETFRRLAQYIVSCYAKALSFRNIASTFQIKDSHTVGNYCQYLCDAYLTFLLPRFSSKMKAISKADRKIYCVDSGVIRCVATEMMASESRLLENVVYLELQRRLAYRNHGNEVFFWRDPHSNREVDFVIRADQRPLELIQVCHSLSHPETREREFRGFEQALASLPAPQLTLITMDDEGEEKIAGKRIEIIPIWKWLLREAKGVSKERDYPSPLNIAVR